MAWTIPDVHFIAPGATVQWWFRWGSGVDHGPQWAMAHPIPGEPDVVLVTERVGKKLRCEIGQIIINGPAQYSCAETGSLYEYRAWITNDGSTGCRYQLQGGGV